MNKYYLTLLLLYWLNGCAGFPSNNIEQVKNETFQNSSKPMIYYQLNTEDNLHSKTSTKFENTQTGEFIRAIRDTNCCHLTSDKSIADIQIHLTISKHQNPAAVPFTLFTRLTLYTIPSWAKTTYTFTAEVTDANNQSLNYSLADSWTIVQWWPFILLYPFHTPEEVDELLLRNMNKALLSKLHTDGVI